MHLTRPAPDVKLDRLAIEDMSRQRRHRRQSPLYADTDWGRVRLDCFNGLFLVAADRDDRGHFVKPTKWIKLWAWSSAQREGVIHEA